MRLAWGIIAAALLAVVVPPGHSVRAQAPSSATKPLAFEVASVKPNGEMGSVSGGCHGEPTLTYTGPPIPVGRCVINAARLSHIITMAFEIPIGRVKGGPDWVRGTPRFNIDAKAEDPNAMYADLTRMLQALLADRFKLRTHREPRPLVGYAMTVARNGPKIKESKAAQPSLVVHGVGVNKLDGIDGKNKDLNTITGKKMTMAEIAAVLSRLPGDMAVVDMTRLTGLYDFSLSWEPDEELARVVQDQLGLHLERQQVPVDFLIIDSADLPSENQ